MRSSAVAVVFVLGAPRSGSTLLGRILGGVDGAVALGEVRNVWQALERNWHCSCGVRLRHCSFWSPVSDAVLADLGAMHGTRPTAGEVHRWHEAGVRRRAHRFVLGRPHRGPAGAYLDALALLYHHAAREAGASVVVDISKLPADAAAARTVTDELRLVHIVRDPRAVVRSRVPERPTGRDGGRLASRVAGEAVAWMALDVCCTALRNLPYSSDAVVRYEDLLAQPAVALGRAVAAIGLPGHPLPRFHGDGVVLPSDHLPVGDSRRRETGLVPLRPRPRPPLGRRDRWLVSAVTAAGLVRYGYGPRAT